MQTQVIWSVTVYQLVNIYQSFEGVDGLTKVPQSFETSVTIYWSMWRNSAKKKRKKKEKRRKERKKERKKEKRKKET
jgi:hypothetical protein